MCSLLLAASLSSIIALLADGCAFNDDNQPELLWQTDHPIFYAFSTDFSLRYRTEVTEILDLLQTKTCLSFEDITGEDLEDHDDTILYFLNSTECSSEVGKNASFKLQEVNIANSCYGRGIIAHEILHSLGLDHTHSRHDRDEHITIVDRETAENYEYEKMTREENKNFEVLYDFHSLMHYPADLKEGKPNILAKDELYQHAMGSNNRLPAHSDLLLINRLYKCQEKCAHAQTACDNGGFVNSRNCKSCICPRGFGGSYCSKGYNNYVATSDWTTLSGELRHYGSYADRVADHWHLLTTFDEQIEIELISVGPVNAACTSWRENGGAEVRLSNFEIGGYVFFCEDQLPRRILRSEGNRAVVSLEAENSTQQFELRFRSVKYGREDCAELNALLYAVAGVNECH